MAKIIGWLEDAANKFSEIKKGNKFIGLKLNMDHFV